MQACGTHVGDCIAGDGGSVAQSRHGCWRRETETAIPDRCPDSIGGGDLTLRLFLVCTWVLMSSFSVFAGMKQTANGVGGDQQKHQQLVSTTVTFEEMLAKAKRGDAHGQLSVGNAYRDGVGVRRDYHEAAKWYEGAANQKIADAELALGFLYEQGWGVSKDYRRAFEYFRAAALQGEPTAENNLASMYQQGKGVKKDLDEASRWYRAAAKAGHAVAQCNLASMYYRGEGVAPDHDEAARWFRAAAEKGVPEAQNILAVMYYKGEGFSVDFGEAAEWARRAAEQGYAPAQADLAYMFEQGKGVPLDYVAAYSWYSVAASGGERHSPGRLKSLSRVMLAEQMREAKARAVAWQAQHGKPADVKESPGALSFLPEK